MSYQSPYTAFIFEDYSFDNETNTARFEYSFDGQRRFTEVVTFTPLIQKSVQEAVNARILDNALQLAFYLAGTSYYKCFPTKQIIFKKSPPNINQAAFLRSVYTEGLSQFIFENDLTVEAMAVFQAADSIQTSAASYNGEGLLALQSGGKDSLLMAILLEKKAQPYSALYISSSEGYPEVLDDLLLPPRVIHRMIDRTALEQASRDGALNGHVPVTYIVESFALIDAILHNEKSVLASIGSEGGEAHAHVADLAVNHQWSKTWEAEKLLAQYVSENISSDLQIGSPLRGYSELRIAELFVEHAWQRFGHSFSSCNRANYLQGADNHTLKWCGECPKCANSYLLFAPFVEPKELQSLFAGQDLFTKPSLTETFKGLLGIDGVMKPFECVGEIDELRLAYHMAQEKFSGDIAMVPFEVPVSEFNYKAVGAFQDWATEILPPVY